MFTSSVLNSREDYITTKFDCRTITQSDAISLADEILLNIEQSLSSLMFQPIDAQLLQSIDHLIQKVIVFYTIRRLYPIPFQYDEPVICTISFGPKKVFELEALYKPLPRIDNRADIKFKTTRQLDYEARHGLGKDS